jgi:hypothetical protein
MSSYTDMHIYMHGHYNMRREKIREKQRKNEKERAHG